MQENELSFFEFSMGRSKAIRDTLQNGGLSDEARQEFRQAAEQSIVRQREIEAADTLSFDDFLDEWNGR